MYFYTPIENQRKNILVRVAWLKYCMGGIVPIHTTLRGLQQRKMTK